MPKLCTGRAACLEALTQGRMQRAADTLRGAHDDNALAGREFEETKAQFEMDADSELETLRTRQGALLPCGLMHVMIGCLLPSTPMLASGYKAGAVLLTLHWSGRVIMHNTGVE